jgi:hypothetical protein
LIQESFALRKESESLLSEAKEMVERDRENLISMRYFSEKNNRNF